MESGKVKAVIATRGYGFIARDTDGSEVFFHVADLPGNVPFDSSLLGQQVTFDIRETEKGKRCIGIQVVAS